MDAPIRYADVDGAQIAYQVTGSGPRDVVAAIDWASNIESTWAYAKTERFLRRIASFARLILFDVRGMGLSDPLPELPPLEDWMADVWSVMDAAGSERAAMLGHGFAGQLGMLTAGSHPERIDALVTVNSFARLSRTDDYPPGMPEEVQRKVLADIKRHWGTGAALVLLAPDIARDPEAIRVWAATERAAGSPKRAVAKQRLVMDVDVRDVLSAIRVPTLVLQSHGSRFVIEAHGRYLADHIEGARYVVLDDHGHWPWTGPDADRFLDEIEGFLVGSHPDVVGERVLATVAFTDIVDSTRLAAELGDRRWRELLQTHDSVTEREVSRMHGRVVKRTGDGMLATCDGPARAIRAVERPTAGRGLAGVGAARGGAHRRGRADRRRCQRPRRAHRRADRCARRAGRAARVVHRPGRRGRIGDHVRGSRHAPAQGRARRVAPVRGVLVTTGDHRSGPNDTPCLDSPCREHPRGTVTR